ncbi:hypothetical protein L3X38_032305 [Prunus dulcis]|uniref:Aminotransferase-like plant mobile domain-containing protein n=1 Tax=Prunus dulcis TaxID=3755 RepID=A0AAD4VEW0_PRUDU|nr:hypothetical protein L3X38_032305 [Prunus dulcis]
MSSPKTRANSSSSLQPPAYLTGYGVDQLAIKVRSKLYPYAQKNLDENSSALPSHTWVSKNLSRSYPTSEVRNSTVKWSDWIDKLLPRDENLLAVALCFWNSASNTFDFRVGPMTLTLLDMAQIFGFRPHGRPADAVGDYHKRKNEEKLPKPFNISPATIN